MAKRFMALLLALLLLLSLSACASAPAGSVESPSHSPAVAAEPSDSPALPHIPVIQSALDARMERWVEEYKEFTPALAQYVDGEPLTIECTAPAEDISRALYALIDRASLVNTTDSELLQIVLRESKVYFGGGTTARQAAQAIDAKVQLYLAEQYG